MREGPLHIGFVTRAMPAHGRGGMEDHTLALAAGLVERGHHVTVVTTGHPDREAETTKGVEIHYVRGTSPRYYSWGWWRKSPGAILELHERRPFDLLHSQSIGAYAFLDRRLNVKRHLPTVLTLHGTPYDEVASRVNILAHSPSLGASIEVFQIGSWVMKYLWFYLGAVARADGVIVTSDEQERLVRRIFFVASDRLFKVYNGMDHDTFTPGAPDEALRQELGLAPDARVLLCVARFARDKGLDQVVRALPDVLRAEPRARLLLVGDGAERGRLVSLVERLGLGDRVRFPGYVPFVELPKYFNLCDAFINATLRRNGYDLTMLEAMACEKLVVSSDVGSTPTLICDGVDGLLVPVGDRRALAARILEALREPERTRELGRRARSKVTSRFTVPRMVEDTLNAYRAVL
ncbi:MAG: glycosyltransferase family 4 protein [Deltaproteobacteria bacterium]|nr:glycosyltransferase family 4 protein [Deltaproteobacteria bacterium]